MLTQTVTLYNRYGGDNPTRWGRTVLTGILWRSGSGTSLQTTGVSGGMVECQLILPGYPGYVEPEAYDGTPGTWTLRSGDAIVVGACEAEDITGPIQKAVPGCKLITGVVDRRYGSTMDHWEVTAR